MKQKMQNLRNLLQLPKYQDKHFKNEDVLDLVNKIEEGYSKDIEDLEWYKEAFKILMYSYNGCCSCIHSVYKSRNWGCDLECKCGTQYECSKEFFENEFKQELSNRAKSLFKDKHLFTEMKINKE